MTLKKAIGILILWYLFCFFASVVSAAGADDRTPLNKFAPAGHDLDTTDVHQTLLDIIEFICDRNGKFSPPLHCDPIWLRYFYTFESRQPNWIGTKGPNAQAVALMQLIARAEQNGLAPETYHFNEIMAALSNLDHAAKTHQTKFTVGALHAQNAARLELLLTDAFFSYGLHLSEGRVDPIALDQDWHIRKQGKNMADVYRRLLHEGEMANFESLLEPGHPGYQALKQSLARYLKIRERGGWRPVHEGRTIKPGDYDNRIVAIRRRLAITDDLDPRADGRSCFFDPLLVYAVKQFQIRHGLDPDGIIGKSTIKALNIPVGDRISVLKMNMERWRWLPDSLGSNYILVNTASFQIHLMENDRPVKTMKAIVGKKDRPTPVMSEKITYMELNPYWNIPHAIAVRDILPRIQKDPGYLKKNRIRVFESWRNNARKLDPDTINWKSMNEHTFSFKLQQEPTKTNALGQMKFMFPNKFAVYLHDTPADHLFNRSQRTFSSGCVRIEKPVELAQYLLKDIKGWESENISAVLDSAKRKVVRLAEPTNIHILYWTAWVDEVGHLNFRNDVYEKDKQLFATLDRQALPYRLASADAAAKAFLASQKVLAAAQGM